MNTDYSVRSDYLRCTEGSSDKVYNLTLNAVRNRYIIIAEYGRYDSVLKEIQKGEYASLASANIAYTALLTEKYGKGYRDIVSRTVTSRNAEYIQSVNRAKERKKAEDKVKKVKKVKKLAENIEEGVRRIDFEL